MVSFARNSAGIWSKHWRVLRDSWALESERLKQRTRWEEADFLPAAIEIIERPPNPLGRVMLWTILAFLVLALVWSVVAKVDVVAVAPGKVIAAGRNKLVQSADGGVVRSILVQDGQQVKAGQPLVTLDPTASGADREQAIANLQTAELDAARSRALLDALRGGAGAFNPPAAAPASLVAVQRQLIASRLAELTAKVQAVQQQAAEAEAARAAAGAEVARLRETLPFLTERANKRRILTEKGYASRLGQLELDQQRVDHERQIAVQVQNQRRAAASFAGGQQQVAQIRSEAIRETLADLAKAEAEARVAREELIKATQRTGLQVVRAPVDGVVQQLAVTSEGSVLKPADPILVVVPSNTELVVEAQVLNRDIGFVRPGQHVTVKLEAFPFTRYGTLEGKLLWVSRDAIQDEKLGPVYQARIALGSNRPIGGGAQLDVSPGLQVTAEIRTSERRVIDFLLSPIERRVKEAGRER
ncbi:MAG: HlyD family type I secretion periplasmic adaptor subunit [Sphingomonas sanxanigenens]|uniref:Membrane fusion protein (MFP) family protein n=1 Tax=Sphingomonas sanxanigenens TaxID=397260 RepID=A0A2W5AC94_9SPHN|nr:MAG: HlyD family type I secretion periplasmic adaptor subunit [Sphingomonas sanxanigenens]